MSNLPPWFNWAQRLQTIAQAGLTYTTNVFDVERYHQIQQIAAEILAAGADAPLEQVHGLLSAEAGYATPKLDVRAVVLREGKMLLVKELSDGGWTLPGGWVDVGDRPTAAAEREVREESGYEVRAVKLLALYDRNLHGYPPFAFHTYKLFFLCELLGGAPTISIETGGAEFFAPDNLPQLSVARVTPQVLARMFELANQPDVPTEFD